MSSIRIFYHIAYIIADLTFVIYSWNIYDISDSLQWWYVFWKPWEDLQ